jgi:4-diphosphocytidyl-2-C-methyl-D-erythritol kinase
MKNDNIYQFRSYAKMNWFLKIGQRRQDGYHNILSVMQLIDFYDTIDLYFTDQNCDEIQCNYEIPTGKKSLLGRLFHLLRDLKPQLKDRYFGVKITKNIPPSSGLGGASSNVANILKKMNEILQLSFENEKMIEISAKLGSDIPFFTTGFPFAIISGKGEKVIPLHQPPEKYIVLVFPEVGIDTCWAYREWDIEQEKDKFQDLPSVKEFIDDFSPNQIEKYIWNDFEKIIYKHLPEFGSYKETLEQMGCSSVFMTGSGSTIIGIAPNQEKAVDIVKELKQKGIHSRWSTTILKDDSNPKVVLEGGENHD